MTGAAHRESPSLARARGLMLAIGLVALLLALAPAPAPASTASEQREGQGLLRSIESGRSSCSDLATADFERIGEYVMGRMAGSTSAHEQMNELMRSMMGARSEEQMHVFMGKRFSDCGAGTIPSGFGGMMGMMGMMGGDSGSGAQGPGFGSMMGSVGYNSDRDGDGWSGAAIVMTVLMGVLLALAVGALLFWRPWSGASGRSPRSPLALLDARYARGDIGAEEYERRRQALGGGR